MNPTFTPHTERLPEPARQRKAMRPNSLRNAQVMPPHHVDLTLSPSTRDDIYVPAHISGADLSRAGPAGARSKAPSRGL